MISLKKTTPKIKIEVIYSNTEELLFEITDRNWSNLGEVFNDHYFSTIVNAEMKNGHIPENITVIAVAEFEIK